MFPFLRFKKRGIVVIDNGRRNLGRVPVHVASELVNQKHASIVHDHPTIIGLRQSGKPIRSEGVKVTGNPLKNIISVAALFASNGSRIQALNSILFEIGNGTLCVKATNLDAYFRGCIEAGKRYTFACDKDKSVCVNALQLKKVLSCHDGCSNIQIINGEPPGLQISSFFVEGFSPNEFPSIQPSEKGRTYPFNITDIAKKLHFVSSAISDNKYRSSLSGVFFDIARQRLVCADGSRLHTTPMADDGKVRGENGAIVPAQVIRVAKYLTGSGKLVENDENRSVVFDLDVPGCVNCIAGFTVIDGKFPDYDSVIPKDFASKFSANIRDILPVLRRAVIANTKDSDAKPIITEFNNGLLKITTKVHSRITYQGVVHGKYNGPQYHCIINAVYLMDAIHDMPGDSIEILLQSGKDQAWTLRNGSGYAAVIMPIDFSKA